MESQPLQIHWLSGTRVVLIGNYVPAPFAAYLLRTLGAEIIKVEQGPGDHLRYVGNLQPSTNTESATNPNPNTTNPNTNDINTSANPNPTAPPFATSPMFRMLNAGFKSISLQWRQPKGAAILRQLLETADIFLDGSRRGAVEQALGMHPEAVSPNLIYVPITAYGQVGPMADLGGHDNNILALGGNLSYTQTTATGQPTVFSAPVADMFAGQMAAFGALAALIGRQNQNPKPQTIDPSKPETQAIDPSKPEAQTINAPKPQTIDTFKPKTQAIDAPKPETIDSFKPETQAIDPSKPETQAPQPETLDNPRSEHPKPETHTHTPSAQSSTLRTLDASMLHAGFFMNFMEIATMNVPGTSEPQAGNAWMNGGRPDYRPYKTSDGKHIFFGLIEAWALTRFFKAIGKPDLIDSIPNPHALHSQLEAIFSEKTQAEWIALGTKHDACITPVNNLAEATQDPQIQALHLTQTVQDRAFGKMQLPTYPLGFGKESQQPTLPLSAPTLGEHTNEILKHLLNLPDHTIATLQEEKIIQIP